MSQRGLRRRLDSYFSQKSIICAELVYLGDELETTSKKCTDKALGLLAQAVGLCWGSDEQQNEALESIQKAMGILDEGISQKKSNDKEIVVLCYGILNFWYGFCKEKLHQTKANNDLAVALSVDKKDYPHKYKVISPEALQDCAIPAISSLTIEDEKFVANFYIKSVDALFATVRNGKKKIQDCIQYIGTNLVTLSARLLAHKLSIFGDTFNAIRAWHIVFVLAKSHSNTIALMRGGSELIKLIPGLLNTHFMEEIGAWKNLRDISIKPVHLLRIQLGKAVACLKTKQFKEGLANLKQVLDFTCRITDNIDVNLLLGAEAHFVLAQYQLVADANLFDIVHELGHDHKRLAEMSPAALGKQACKVLPSLVREFDLIKGGWNEVVHSSQVLQAVMEIFPGTIEFCKKSGKLKTVCYLTSDFVYLTQQLGLVSRTIQALLPVIEMDLRSCSFYECLSKLECIVQMTNSCDKDEEEGRRQCASARKTGAGTVGSDSRQHTPSSRDMLSRLHAMGIQVNRDDLNTRKCYWQMPPIHLPDHHYTFGGNPKAHRRRRGNDNRQLQTVGIPYYLLHALDCSCYLCRHPFIHIVTIKSLVLQARYLSCAKAEKDSLALIKCVKYYLLRNIARTGNQYYPLLESLNLIMEETLFISTINSVYSHLLYESVFHWAMTFMEIVPFQDVKMIINIYNWLMQILNTFSKDTFDYLYPKEVVTSAIFAYMIYNKLIFVHGSDLRDKGLVACDIRSTFNFSDENKLIDGEYGDCQYRRVRILPEVTPTTSSAVALQHTKY